MQHYIAARRNAFPAVNVARSWRIAPLVVLAVFGLSGCGAVPQKQFEVYRSNFSAAKVASEDIILQAKLAAEQVAKLPANPATPEERKAALAERTAALDARLQALNLIAQYNDVLIALAAGDDPAAIQSNLQDLQKGLSSFGASKLTALVEKAGPLGGVISEAVSAIDVLIKQKKFRDATLAAQPAIVGIIGELQTDADRIPAIQTQLIELKRDPDWNKLANLKKRLAGIANKYAKNKNLDDLALQYDKQIGRLQPRPTDPTLLALGYAPTGSTAATDEEIEVMKGLLDEVARRVDSYNAFGDEIEAYDTAISKYRTLLASVTLSFVAMNSAAGASRTEAITNVVNHGLALRQAVLAYQEVKRK